LDHNKRQCKTPDANKEHSQVTKASKRKGKKQEKEQKVKIVIVSTAITISIITFITFINIPSMNFYVQEAQVQQPHVHQDHVQQPHVPPKKKQKKNAVQFEQSSSQPAPSHTPSSQSSGGMQFPSSRTIPMSQVVTEEVPHTGRMKWYLWGNKNQDGQGGEGGAGVE
jgi:cytoskeletal protein RodZ